MKNPPKVAVRKHSTNQPARAKGAINLGEALIPASGLFGLLSVIEEEAVT